MSELWAHYSYFTYSKIPILMTDAQSKQLVLLGIVIGSMGKNDTQDCLKVVLISNLTKKAKQLTNLATLSNMQSVS